MVQELAFYKGKTRVDANMDPHFNLVCTKCWKIEELYHEKVHELVTYVSEHTSFTIHSQRVDFYGICRDCQKQR